MSIKNGSQKRSGHPPQGSEVGGWGPLIQANQLASYRLKATSYRLQATRLQATGYKSLRLQATGYKIRGWRYKCLALTVWNTPCVPKARWRSFSSRVDAPPNECFWIGGGAPAPGPPPWDPVASILGWPRLPCTQKTFFVYPVVSLHKKLVNMWYSEFFY